jgi:hypothetical protein
MHGDDPQTQRDGHEVMNPGTSPIALRALG